MAKTIKKTIGYLRVSTADQDLDKNKSDILHLANEKKLGTVRVGQRDSERQDKLEEAKDCSGD